MCVPLCAPRRMGLMGAVGPRAGAGHSVRTHVGTHCGRDVCTYGRLVRQVGTAGWYGRLVRQGRVYVRHVGHPCVVVGPVVPVSGEGARPAVDCALQEGLCAPIRPSPHRCCAAGGLCAPTAAALGAQPRLPDVKELAQPGRGHVPRWVQGGREGGWAVWVRQLFTARLEFSVRVAGRQAGRQAGNEGNMETIQECDGVGGGQGAGRGWGSGQAREVRVCATAIHRAYVTGAEAVAYIRRVAAAAASQATPGEGASGFQPRWLA